MPRLTARAKESGAGECTISTWRVGGGEPGGGAVGAAVVDDYDLLGRLVQDGGQLRFEQRAAAAGGDHDGDAGSRAGAAVAGVARA